MKIKLLAASAAVSALVLAASAAQATVTFVVSGSVTAVDSGIASGFTMGSAVSGYIQYDETRATTAASGYSYANNAFSGFFVIGGKRYDYVPTTSIAVSNDTNGRDLVQFYSSASSGPSVGGFAPNYMTLDMYDYTHLAIGSEALPTASQIRNLPTMRFSLYLGPNYANQVKAVMSSLTVVPEPASWALMIAGFGLIGGALRRRPAMLTQHG